MDRSLRLRPPQHMFPNSKIDIVITIVIVAVMIIIITIGMGIRIAIVLHVVSRLKASLFSAFLAGPLQCPHFLNEPQLKVRPPLQKQKDDLNLPALPQVQNQLPAAPRE